MSYQLKPIGVATCTFCIPSDAMNGRDREQGTFAMRIESFLRQMSMRFVLVGGHVLHTPTTLDAPAATTNFAHVVFPREEQRLELLYEFLARTALEMDIESIIVCTQTSTQCRTFEVLANGS